MKRLFSTLLLLVSCLISYSQTLKNVADGNNQPIVNVHSPSVASLMKAIDNPVGLYNGNPEISHTLYTLKDGAIEIPITLQYNASGIKVAEEASWVGLGWNLNVGGMIVQNVVGKEDYAPDFKCKYPDSMPTGSFSGYAGIPYSVGDKSKYDIFYQKATEARLQPDVFYFSYPGGSGKFFIDYRDNSIHSIDASKSINIESFNEHDWKITTEDGIIHFFKALPPATEIGNAANVTSRISILYFSIYPNGQQTKYYYSDRYVLNYSYHEYSEHLLKCANGVLARGQCMSEGQGCITGTYSREALMDSIITDNYTIVFNKSDRKDIGNGLKLDEIEIRTQHLSGWGNFNRRFHFEYGDFTNTVTGKYWSGGDDSGFFDINRLKKRLKLCSVYEQDVSGNKNNRLEFDYYNPNALPVKTSYAVDYWGYYNGQTDNITMIPNFRYLLWGQSSEAEQHQVEKKSAIRACNPECLHNGMLKTITYATGGVTEYVYEPHEFSGIPYIPTWDELQNLDPLLLSPTMSITERNSPSDPEYIDFNVEIGDEIYIEFELSQGENEWKDMLGSKYTLMRINPHGSIPEIIKNEEFNLANVSNSHFKMTLRVNAEKSGNHRLYISIPEELGNQNGAFTKHGYLIARIYLINHSIEKRGYSRGGGVRVKQVNYYDAKGNSVSAKTLNYEYPLSFNNGRLFTPITFHRIYRNLRYGQTTYSTEGRITSYAHGVDGIEMTMSSNNFHSAPYSTSGSTVCYNKAVVKQSRNGIEAGYTQYIFRHAQEISTNGCYQMPEVGSGKPYSITHYDVSGRICKSESYNYSLKRKHFYTGLTIVDHFNRSSRFYVDNSHGLFERYDLLDLGDYENRYITTLYSLSSYQDLLTKKVICQDGVATTETYTYDDYCQLKRKDVTGSNGKIYSWLYTYPHDFSCGIYASMASMHLHSYPVEEKRLCDGKIVGGKLTQYQLYPLAGFLPSSQSNLSITTPISNAGTFSCNGSNPTYYPYEDITYLHYDKIGNPVNVKIKGEEIVYLWGYAYQYPIAEIRGSSYSEVQSVLGCTPSSLSSAIVPDSARLSALKMKLPNAHITTYTYQPLVGMTSMTAPGGEVTTYEYDRFGRLLNVKDHSGKSIKQYDYHYRP